MDAIEERVELGSIDALVRFADGAWSIVLVAAGTSEPIETVSIDGLDADGLDSVIDDLLDVVDEVDREAAPPLVMQAETRVTNAGRDRAVELLREVQRMVDDGTRVLSRDATERFNLLRADIEAPSTADEDAIGRASALRDEIAALPRREMDLDAVADRVGAELFAAGLVAPEEKPDDLDDGTREAFELNSRAMNEIAEVERVGDPSALAMHRVALVEVSRRVADLAEKITHRISGESKTPGAELLSLAQSTMGSVDVVVDRVVRESAAYNVNDKLPSRAVLPVIVGKVHVASVEKTPVEASVALYNRLVVPQGGREDHYGEIQANAARLLHGAASAIRSAISAHRSPSEAIVYGQQEHDPRRSYFVEPTPGAPMVPRFITDKIVLTMVRPEGERYPTGVRLALDGESAAPAVTAPPPAPPAIDPKAKLRMGPDDTAPSAADLATFAEKLAEVRRHLANLDETIFASERENVATGAWATIEGMLAAGEPVRHRAIELAVYRMGESINQMIDARGGFAGMTPEEKLARPGRKLFATTAKDDYDGFGTFTVIPAADGYVMAHDRAGEWKGKTRVVSVDEQRVDWQSNRYFTGMHRPFPVTEEAVRAFYGKRSAPVALDVEATDAQREKLAQVIAALVAEGHEIEGVGYRPEPSSGVDTKIVDVGYVSPIGKHFWTFVEDDGHAGGGDGSPWPYTFKPSELLRAPPTRESVKARSEAAVLAAIDNVGGLTPSMRASWREAYQRDGTNKAYMLRLRSLVDSLKKSGVMWNEHLLSDALKEAELVLPLLGTDEVRRGNGLPLPECPTNGVAFVVPYDEGRGVIVAAYRVDGNNEGGKRRVSLTDAFDAAVRAAGGTVGPRESGKHGSTAAGVFGAEQSVGTHGKAYVYVDSAAIARAAYDSFVASMKPLGLAVRDRLPRGTEFDLSAPLVGQSRMAGSDVEIDVSESLRYGAPQNERDDTHNTNVRALLHDAGLAISKPSFTHLIAASLAGAPEAKKRALYALCPDVYLEEHEADETIFDLRRTVADDFVAAVKPGMKVTWATIVDTAKSGVRTKDVVVTFVTHVLGLADHAVRLGSKEAPRGRTETSVNLPGDRYVIVWPRILTEAERDAVEDNMPAELAAERDKAFMSGIPLRRSDERRMLAAVEAIELKPLVYGRPDATVAPAAPSVATASAPATGDGPAARIFYQYGLHVDASGPGASDEDVNAAAVAGELALAKALGVKHKPSGRNAVGVDADGHVRTTGVILTEAGWMLPDDVTKIKPAQRALMANQGEAQRIVVGAVAATLRGRGYTVTAEVDGDDNSVTVSTKAAKTKDMKTKAATKNAPADRGIWTVLVKRADDPTAVDYESKAAGELQQVTESLSAGGSMEAELSHWKGAEIMASDDAKAKVARLRLVASALRFAADPIRGGTTEDMERWEGMGEPELGVSQSDVDDALRGIAPILTALKETGAKDRTESTNEEMPDVLYLGQHPDSADVPYVLTTGYSEALPLGTVLRRDDGYVFVKNAQRDQWQLSDPSKFGVPVIARGASGKFRVTEYEPAAALLASASIADVRPVVTSKGFGKERIVTGWRAWVKVPESDEVMADYVRLASGAAKSEFVSILTKRMELFTGVPVEFRDGPEDSFVSTSNLVIEFVPKAVAPAGALDESDVLAMFDDV